MSRKNPLPKKDEKENNEIFQLLQVLQIIQILQIFDIAYYYIENRKTNKYFIYFKYWKYYEFYKYKVLPIPTWRRRKTNKYCRSATLQLPSGSEGRASKFKGIFLTKYDFSNPI